MLQAYTSGSEHPYSFRNTTDQPLPTVDEFGNSLKKENVTDWLPEGRGSMQKDGTYHWDEFNPNAATGDHAVEGSHLQIHNFDGSIYRIFYKN